MTPIDPALSPRRSTLQRAITAVGVAELAIGSVSLVLILVFVLTQAGQRYLPFEGWAWTGELSRFALIWLTFSAMGILVTARGHIALEVVDTFKNPMVVRVVQVFALAVVAAVGVGLAIEAASLVQSQGILRSAVLRVPMSLVYIPVLIGAISTAIRATVAAIDIARHGPVIATGVESGAKEA